ncbi:MAG TPA: SMC-Scp complex subunit ScpB [Chitinophagales bacterium]|nr:SMC-Scp complex subunit ScpB [Chitinophagales bacterium]HNF69041.1 SMC-Scp complex subunit ScpB [Chitinophagales bacterium]HNJ89249.1 SMC-Scp complex subunit ScpB [Chitinophagales bacterium]HNM07119.1 SMC-Scp complex subunit ScpB [Chitinophagales bacterium]HNM28558.1 SMC-Scp complex subunit ScpB [Chitinophagales bacterium]
MNDLQKLIEALIFSSEQPISAAELQTVLFTYSGEEVSLEAIQEHVEGLIGKYESDDFVFEVVKTGGGFQFLSKPYYHKPITVLLQHRSKRKLSVAALECLSIIAYSQPVTKVDIEQIRGVNCDHTIQKLMERDLIRISGRAETAGRPLLYGTTQYFMDYFGINTLEELPKLKEFEQKEVSIGDPSDIMEGMTDEEVYNKVQLNNERRDDAQTDNNEENQQSDDQQEVAAEAEAGAGDEPLIYEENEQETMGGDEISGETTMGEEENSGETMGKEDASGETMGEEDRAS